MALTSTQRAQVRFYLGYSDVSQGGAPNALETAMTDITAPAEVLVTTILANLATADAALLTVESSARAGIVSVDNGGVVWANNGASASMVTERAGRRMVGRLASLIGVPVGRDVFGSSLATSGPCGLG